MSCAFGLLLCAVALAPPAEEPVDKAIRKAVAYLAYEVPAWPKENGCFSCHNNGDGLRALTLAQSRGFPFDAGALTATVQWLRMPEQWDSGAKRPGVSDLKLARLQMVVALNSLPDTATDIKVAGARLVEQIQESDGAWRIETGNMPGSPITWGSPLATAMALGIEGLSTSARNRAQGWLRSQRPGFTVDLAALLLALPAELAVIDRVLPQLRDGQTPDGGWGPRKGTPPEVFDTAITLLALQQLAQSKRPDSAIQRGRTYLLSQQLDNGSWPETTRPSGQQSYAHHISTTAWATLALLAGNAKRQ